MDRITAKSTSKDVQAAAGHDRTHWRRFLVCHSIVLFFPSVMDRLLSISSL